MSTKLDTKEERKLTTKIQTKTFIFLSISFVSHTLLKQLKNQRNGQPLVFKLSVAQRKTKPTASPPLFTTVLSLLMPKN